MILDYTLRVALNMPILALLIHQTWKYKSGLMRKNETCVIWRSRCLKVKASLFWYTFNQPFLASNVCNTAMYVCILYLNTNPQATYFPNLDWHFQMANPPSNNCTIQYYYVFCILALQPFDPYSVYYLTRWYTKLLYEIGISTLLKW